MPTRRSTTKKTKARKKRRKKKSGTTDLSAGVMAAVSKKHKRSDGHESAVRLDAKQRVLAAVRGGVSTQSLALNIALGRPGIPLGRITEISGLEVTGKSTLGAHLLAEAQRRDGVAILVDTECSYELDHAHEMGIDSDTLVVLQPRFMEEVFGMVETAVKAIPEDVSPIVVVWDSVALTMAQAEWEGKYDDRFVGVHARILSQGLRKMQPLVAARGVALVCVNQLRDNIAMGPYRVEQYKSFGGHAMRYSCSVRIRLKKGRVDVVGKRPVGVYVKAKVIKNKVGPPYGECELYIDFRKGLDRVRDLIDLGVEYNILDEGRGTVVYRGQSCRVRDFRKKLLPVIGGAPKLARAILRQAKEKGLIRPYSVPWEEPS